MEKRRDERETLLQVEGMTCEHCVRHVGEALRGVAGVTAVDVRLAEGRAFVRHADGAVVAKMVEALGEAGYPARAA